jgi:hypothetical protein
MKTRRRKPASPNRSRAPKAARSRTPSAADQESEVAALRRELSEARQQQTAASEVLQIIARSPGDLEHVFQAMLAKAVRILRGSIRRIVPVRGTCVAPGRAADPAGESC